MLSLGNARGADEFRAWEQRLENRLKRFDIEPGEITFVAEPKIDGIAISLLYEDGEFVRGATRGDGVIGEDVTANLRTIDAIPDRIDDAPKRIEVRGEIYFPRSGFAELNEQRAAEGLSTFANPRNATAGTIRQLDPEVTASRPLSLWGYGTGGRDGIEFDSHSEELGVDARARLPGQRRDLEPRGWRVGGRALPVVGAAPRVARLRDRRRRRQGRPAGAVARTRGHRARAALGDRVEVPADHGDHDPEQDRLERRADRAPSAVRDAGAGPRRRGHGLDRDPAQRGGSRAQGRARARRGDRHPRRRRDPAGDRPADPAPRGQAPAQGAPAEAVPDLRDADGQGRGLGVDDLPEPPRLPRPDLPAGQALPGRDGHRGAGREERDALPRRGADHRPGLDLRPRGGADRGARRLRRDVRSRRWSPRSSVPSRVPSAASSTRSGCRGSGT